MSNRTFLKLRWFLLSFGVLVFAGVMEYCALRVFEEVANYDRVLHTMLMLLAFAAIFFASVVAMISVHKKMQIESKSDRIVAIYCIFVSNLIGYIVAFLII